MVAKVDGMGVNQIIRLVKKWCDDNPHKTHLPLFDILWEVTNSLE